MCSHIYDVDGNDFTIKKLAETKKESVSFKGKINFGISKPESISRKLLNIKRTNNIGFKHQISLKDDINETDKEFIKFDAIF
ncbi:hypothetical protein N8Z20_02270 [Pelagibacteraceae bacterium]|nr:hypothetical protein [Pelagibacteraceae bacterium]